MRTEPLAEWRVDGKNSISLASRVREDVPVEWLERVGACINVPMIGTPIRGISGAVWREPVCLVQTIASVLDISVRQVNYLVADGTLAVSSDGYRMATSLAELWDCLPNKSRQSVRANTTHLNE